MTKVIWVQEPIHKKNLELGKSVFLAGPTPRSFNVKSWRPQMIEKIKKLDSALISEILVPEPGSGKWQTEYINQVEWEYKAIEACDILVFWIPRNIKGGMPGFTTNVEFGFWLDKKEIILLGHPPEAEKVKYLDWLYQKHCNLKPVYTMEDLIIKIAEAAKSNSPDSSAGERHSD